MNGLRFFTYCADAWTLLSSSFETMFLWLGGSGYTSNHIPVFGSRPTDYQQEGNSQFLQSFAGLFLDERIIDQVFFDYDLIQTGDILVARRFTGLTAQQMLFSGSYASHVALVIRDEYGQKFVIECREDWTTDKKTGVMKTTLDDWVVGAYQAGYEAAWLPLRRKSLNDVEKHLGDLNAWFDTVEGNSYSPVKDFLASFNSESMPMYMRTANKMERYLGMRPFWNEFKEAIGFRFQEKIKDRRISKSQLPDSLDETLQFASIDLNMSLQDLLAIPEKDEWRYDTQNGREAFTPASFVVQALQKLRVLTRLDINASEFTVKDIYELNIFENRFEKPESCLEADHRLPFCQMFGKFRLHLPSYNSLSPYDHMNETCPNKFENSWRPAGC